MPDNPILLVRIAVDEDFKRGPMRRDAKDHVAVVARQVRHAPRRDAGPTPS